MIRQAYTMSRLAYLGKNFVAWGLQRLLYTADDSMMGRQLMLLVVPPPYDLPDATPCHQVLQYDQESIQWYAPDDGPVTGCARRQDSGCSVPGSDTTCTPPVHHRG